MNGENAEMVAVCRSELVQIQSWIQSNKFDSNVRYLVLYSVIKACGTIERVLKVILFDYLSEGTNNETENFLSKYIVEASFNPGPGKIMNLLSVINNNWAITFDNAIKGSNQKSELKSLVGLRNSFAHGDSITASIETIIHYFDSGVWVLERLYEIIHPNSDESTVVDTQVEQDDLREAVTV